MSMPQSYRGPGAFGLAPVEEVEEGDAEEDEDGGDGEEDEDGDDGEGGGARGGPEVSLMSVCSIDFDCVKPGTRYVSFLFARFCGEGDTGGVETAVHVTACIHHIIRTGAVCCVPGIPIVNCVPGTRYHIYQAWSIHGQG